MRRWWEIIWECIVVIVSCAAIVVSVGVIGMQGNIHLQLSYLEKKMDNMENNLAALEIVLTEVTERVDLLWRPHGF